MQPKFNKLITLLLLLGTFAFLMEAEQRITSFAKDYLSKWASILPAEDNPDRLNSINPYKQRAFTTRVLFSDTQEKESITIN